MKEQFLEAINLNAEKKRKLVIIMRLFLVIDLVFIISPIGSYVLGINCLLFVALIVGFIMEVNELGKKKVMHNPLILVALSNELVIESLLYLGCINSYNCYNKDKNLGLLLCFIFSLTLIITSFDTPKISPIFKKMLKD